MNELCNHIRILPIRIELHGESSRLDLSTEFWQISVDRWFSATNRYPIEDSDTTIEKVIEYLLRNMSRLVSYDLIWYYHLGIVTISTSEITSSGEYYGRNMTWIVDEGTLLESCKYHILKNKIIHS